jgi:hypothetical protein
MSRNYHISNDKGGTLGTVGLKRRRIPFDSRRREGAPASSIAQAALQRTTLAIDSGANPFNINIIIITRLKL